MQFYLFFNVYTYSGCSSGWNGKIAFAVFLFRKLYIECYMDVSTYTKKYINFVAERVCVFFAHAFTESYFPYFFSVSIYLKTIKSIQTYVKYNLHIRIQWIIYYSLWEWAKKCIFHMVKCIPNPNAKQVNVYVERKNIIHVLSSYAFFSEK